jgi:hypothetical protein
MPRKRNTLDDFWPSVDRSGDGCWPWTGNLHPGSGYGRFWLNGRLWRAHRIAYELTYGPIPAGLMVCHTCDNPPCCRPEHLFPGTSLVNMQDKMAKGRGNTGVKNGHARLTPALVEAIRHRYATGNISYGKLADEFGLESSHVWKIVNRKQWA